MIANESRPRKFISIGAISNICIQVTDGCGFNTNDLGITKN
ncbi:MAG: hypothetical protein ACI8X3_003496, partial [Saprospiraceae bacterium]